MNKIILIGHLGKDAEVRNFENNSVINFTIATTEKYKDKQGQSKTTTEWHNVSYFVKSAGIAQYLTKGTQVMVEGAIKKEEYTNAQGEKREAYKINANKIELLSNKTSNQQPAREQRQQSAQKIAEKCDDVRFDEIDDGLPF